MKRIFSIALILCLVVSCLPSLTFGAGSCEHAYSQTLFEPTCKEDGFTMYLCRLCGDCYQDEFVPALGHDLEMVPIYNGGCSYDYYESCNRCEYIHDVSTDNHGYTYGACLLCGDTETQTLDTIERVPCDGGESCWSHRFTDVPSVDHWAHEGIDFAVAMGLFNGISEDTFAPNRTMTRAMLVTVLWRYAGSPVAGENAFTDVENGLWYTDAITWAAENQIVTGVGNYRFNPKGDVTREQLATILYRFADLMGAETEVAADLSTYPDGETVSTWAAEAMAWAVENELIKGILQEGQAYLTPKGAATRAQVATILMRYIENLPVM